MPTYQFPDANDVPPVLPDTSQLVNQLLSARGIDNAELAREHLAPNYETGLHDPALLHDIDAAVARIKAALAAGERIAIFSDYDCDGIPGAVVLHDLFTALQHEDFQTYIPHRHFEGFGLSTTAIDTLAAAGVTLIITIDCGTSNVAEVAHAKQCGVDVIITDHHEPEEELPAAVAVVNPKLGTYPFPHLCGAAVAFKLAQAVLAGTDHSVPSGHEKWWLDMVGVATVADMVPLLGENRVLAHYGLQVLRKSRRPGLQQLLRKARVDQRYLSEDDIGFIIGPRINAASRMDTPEDAYHLLAERNEAAAGTHVTHLEGLNQERKTRVAQMTKDLHKRLERLPEIPPVLVLGNPEWRPSLVGLAASKLAEEHARPVFLWGRDGNGVLKGSCRSGGEVSVVTLMQECADAFLEYGGHHASGGFSVTDAGVHTLGERLNDAFTTLGEKAAVQEPTVIDVELVLDEVNERMLRDLDQLGPFGTGYRKPLFAFRGVTPTSVEAFGKTQEHTKLRLSREAGPLEAIAFFRLPDSFTTEPREGETCTLIGHVERSFFRGRHETRIRIVDIVE